MKWIDNVLENCAEMGIGVGELFRLRGGGRESNLPKYSEPDHGLLGP